MAEIHVERKRATIWPWIVGLLVLALLIWAVAEMVGTDEDEVVETPVVEETFPAAETPPGPATLPAPDETGTTGTTTQPVSP